MGGDGQAGGRKSKYYRELRRWGSDVESIEEGIHAISQVLVSVRQQSTLPLKTSDLPHSGPCLVHTILPQLMFQFYPEGFFALLNLPLKFFLQCLYFVPVTLPESRFFWFSRAFRVLVTQGLLLGKL